MYEDKLTFSGKKRKSRKNKRKSRGGRSQPPTPNPSNGNEFIDNDNNNWVNELVCPYNRPNIHPDDLWVQINVPPQLGDNKEMWKDICQDREREERRQRPAQSGGKKRK